MSKQPTLYQLVSEWDAAKKDPTIDADDKPENPDAEINHTLSGQMEEAHNNLLPIVKVKPGEEPTWAKSLKPTFYDVNE